MKLEGLFRNRGDCLEDSHGIPGLSFSLRTDFLAVSDGDDDCTAFWLLASDENKINEADRTRYNNSRIFLYEIPDPNTD